VTRGDVVASVSATGTLEPVTTVQVGTQVSGTIKALHADFNSEVRRGEVVAELEPSLFQTQVDQAQATLVRLEADADRASVEVEDTQGKLRRAQELSDQKLIARTDLETAQAAARQAEASAKSAAAQITQARAALNQSEVTLGHTVIRAPIDGIVISRSVDVGQTVAASMQAPTLFVIAQDLTRMQVSASIDEADIGHIVAGQGVSFRVDAYPNETFSGTVSQVRLEPKTEQNVVSYTTIISVPNPGLKLKPGMTANVTVRIATDAGVLRVPNAALRFRPPAELVALSGSNPSEAAGRRTAGAGPRAANTGEPHAANAGGSNGPAFGRVWVMRDGAVQEVRVRTGVTDGVQTAVREGDLREGDRVITAVADLAASATPAAGASSPLLPVGRRGGGQGAAAGRAGAGR
jgi:HlyD family secretion protein